MSDGNTAHRRQPQAQPGRRTRRPGDRCCCCMAWPARWQDYVTLIPTLAARWQVLALDFRGHGRSSARCESTWWSTTCAMRCRRSNIILAEPGRHLRPFVGGDGRCAPWRRTPAPRSRRRAGRSTLRLARLANPPDRLSRYVHGVPPTGRHGQSVDELAEALCDMTLSTPRQAATHCGLGELRDPAALRFMASCLNQLDPATMTPLVDGRWLEGYDQACTCCGESTCPRAAPARRLLAGGHARRRSAPPRVAALLPRPTCVKVGGRRTFDSRPANRDHAAAGDNVSGIALEPTAARLSALANDESNE